MFRYTKLSFWVSSVILCLIVFIILQFIPKAKAESRLSLTATGIIINDNTVISTKHSLEKCTSIKASNKIYDIMGDAKRLSNKWDIGVIRFPDNSFKDHIKIKDNINLGDDIYALSLIGGYERGNDIKFTKGNISSESFFVDEYFTTTAFSYKGSSGGGTFDANGNLIGMIIANDKELPSSFSYGLKSSYIIKLLNEFNIKYYSSNNSIINIKDNLNNIVIIDCFIEE